MSEEKSRALKISNATYDALRQGVQFWLPATATFYFTISQIWNLEYGEEVVGTIAALTTLLGVFLGISRSSYYKSDTPYDGSLIVGDEQLQKLAVDLSYKDLSTRDNITLKVDKNPDSNPLA